MDNNQTMENAQTTESRKERRVDYSRKEIADAVFCSENTVENKIKKFLQDYGLPENYFKREEELHRNYFPPEYTPLLILLLQHDDDNPLTMKEFRKKKVTATDVKKYNDDMLSCIFAENRDIPDEIKELVKEMPFARISQDIVDWMDLLLEELQQLIYNLLALYDNDLGETIKYICREIDKMNYKLFRKSYIQMWFSKEKTEYYDQLGKKISEYSKKEAVKKQLEDLDEETVFSKDPIGFFSYNTLRDGANFEKIDKNNMSIDQGIVSIMKAIMHGMGHDYKWKHGGNPLEQHYSEKIRKKVEETYSKLVPNYIEEADKKERRDYLKEKMPFICEGIRACCIERGKHSFRVRSENKWKSIIGRINDGSFREDIDEEYRSGGYDKKGITLEDWHSMVFQPPEELFNEICKAYVSHYNKIKEDTFLYQIINVFVGQMIAHYYTGMKSVEEKT